MTLENSKANELSRAELVASIIKYARDEREALAHFIVYAAEAERRKLYRLEGKSSLFIWFRESFGMSESAACRRITLIKFLARKPEVETEIKQLLLNAEAHLEGLCLVVPFVERGATDLLQLIKGKSTREIELYLAQNFAEHRNRKRKDKERTDVVRCGE